MNLSVLLSVYINTDPDELSLCLDSVMAQTVTASEIVIVLDGPVKPTVRTCIDEFEKKCPAIIKVLEFEHNRGLGAALADGILACSSALVARVDTDDICLPERFEMQLQEFHEDNSLSVVGAQLEERYSNSAEEVKLLRAVPIDSSNLIKIARYRNPINHPTVMFRREDVLKAGNYQTVLWFEDYFLWARMLLMGFRFRNIDKVLVRAEANTSYFDRRGGLDYLKQEILLAKRFREIGFHNLLQSSKFILTRALFRIAPVGLRTRFYFHMLRNSQSQQTSG